MKACFWLLLCSFVLFAAAQDIDLNTLSAAKGFRIFGAAEGDQSGRIATSAGDVNGDGIADVIIGAVYASGSIGVTYVIFGRSLATQVINPLDDIQLPTGPIPASTGFRILGAAASDESGWSVNSAGDVNADGVGDVIIGAHTADPPGGANAGISYVIFGRSLTTQASSPFGDIQLTSGATPLSDNIGFRILGAATSDYSGSSVGSAGDINDDNIDDIIVGARGADPPNRDGAGIAYVVFGRTGAGAFGDILLTTGGTALSPTIGFRILGAAAMDYTGYAVSYAGDVNHDGVDDVIVGAYGADPEGGTGAGIDYVIFGRSSGTQFSFPFGDIQLQTSSVAGNVGFRIMGAAAGDQVGHCVNAAGDVNGDDVSDIIVGAHYADPPVGINAGITYVVFGRNIAGGAAAFGDIQLTTGATAMSVDIGFRILGAAMAGYSGLSVSSAGDVNGDGVGDVIVGAYAADPLGRTDAGISYVVFGRSLAAQIVNPFGDIQLATDPMTASIGFRILGAVTHDESGRSVSRAGDVNGDGIDDIIVGANYADSSSLYSAGTSYVIFGELAKPTSQPSSQPSYQPSRQPTCQPSRLPSQQPSNQPTTQPTVQPFGSPTWQPSVQPTQQPFVRPTGYPSSQPSQRPTAQPSALPSGQPSTQPTKQPTSLPSDQPNGMPSAHPTSQPSTQPTTQPSYKPTTQPSSQPSAVPSMQYTSQPSGQPSVQPTRLPSGQPSRPPTAQPTRTPSGQPTTLPTQQPSLQPSVQPTVQPFNKPSLQPLALPSSQPSCQPSSQPDTLPTGVPSGQPTCTPSAQVTKQPSALPSSLPSTQPSASPTTQPSLWPTRQTTNSPSAQPSSHPTSEPFALPSKLPISTPTSSPSSQPTDQPTNDPTTQPSTQPTAQPSNQPSGIPSTQPSVFPSTQITCEPSTQPSVQPSTILDNPATRGEWVIETNNTGSFNTLTYVNGTLWVCGSDRSKPQTTCAIFDSFRGSVLAQHFLPWAHISSVMSSMDGSSVVLCGRMTVSTVPAYIATCTIGTDHIRCKVQLFKETTFTASSLVASVKKFVFVGTHGVEASVTVTNSAVDTFSTYHYSSNMMKSIVLLRVCSPPSYLGGFVAGLCVSSTSETVHIFAGVVRTDSGTMAAMYMSSKHYTIINTAELVNAMVLEFVSPNSFIAGGIELSDGAGTQAYIICANSLYYSVLYGVRYRLSPLVPVTRRLQETFRSSSVVRGMALADAVIYMLVDYTPHFSSDSRVAVLMTDTKTGKILKQVQIHSPAASISCSNIAAVGIVFAISCTRRMNGEYSGELLFAADRDLSLSRLPEGLQRYENDTFLSETVPFHRTVLQLNTQDVASSSNNSTYIFTEFPSMSPTSRPSYFPSGLPSGQPSNEPSSKPSVSPQPTSQPSSSGPTNTYKPTLFPTELPSGEPTVMSTVPPTVTPTTAPSVRPTASTSTLPSLSPTAISTPSIKKTLTPACTPTRSPTVSPPRELSPAPTAAQVVVQSKTTGDDQTWFSVIGYVVAGIFGVWLLHYLRWWCFSRVSVVQSDKNRVLYTESMGAGTGPQFPILSYICSFFLLIEAVEVDFIDNDTNMLGSVEATDLEANIPTSSAANNSPRSELAPRDNLVGTNSMSTIECGVSVVPPSVSTIGELHSSSALKRYESDSSEGDFFVGGDSGYFAGKSDDWDINDQDDISSTETANDGSGSTKSAESDRRGWFDIDSSLNSENSAGVLPKSVTDDLSDGDYISDDDSNACSRTAGVVSGIDDMSYSSIIALSNSGSGVDFAGSLCTDADSV